MIREQGDIVSLGFDPSLRHEPAGRHYAVVLSPRDVNSACSLTTVVPVAWRDYGHPLHVRIAEGNEINGNVQCEAVCAMDLDAKERRGAVEIIGQIDLCADSPCDGDVRAKYTSTRTGMFGLGVL